MRTATLVPDPVALALEEIDTDDVGVTLVVRAHRPPACCPRCDQAASRVHSWYTRRLADVPWQGLAACLRLRTRRWLCDNPCTARLLNGARQIIETVNDRLTEQFGLARHHAHTLQGLCARLHTKLAAHTLCLYLNRALGSVDWLQIKHLAFPGN